MDCPWCKFSLISSVLFICCLQGITHIKATEDVIIPLDGKLSSQSSTFEHETSSETWPSGWANKAVDNDTRGNYRAGSCSHTEHNAISPWWMVDLAYDQCVGKVEIFNRDDYEERLKGAIVRVGPNSNRDNPACGAPISLEQINASQKIEVTCEHYGQYLSIELYSTEPLTLCEVRAYSGHCQDEVLSETTSLRPSASTTSNQPEPANETPKPTTGDEVLSETTSLRSSALTTTKQTEPANGSPKPTTGKSVSSREKMKCILNRELVPECNIKFSWVLDVEKENVCRCTSVEFGTVYRVAKKRNFEPIYIQCPGTVLGADEITLAKAFSC